MFTYIFKRIYGRSYFGSGGGYGKVTHCSNCRLEGKSDNGFMSGPEKVVVIDPLKKAKFNARGGDCIGEDGRSWKESGQWIPTQGWVLN